MLQAVTDRLEAIGPRGLWMVPVCIVLFNVWRGQPYPLAHAVNAAGVMAIVLALAAFRLAPREVITTGLVLLLGCIAATLATPTGGESNIARWFIGGLMLLAAWTAYLHASSPWDWALAIGLSSEVAAWGIGNAARGTFGPDAAVSAIGQALGPLAQPGQWALIIIAYLMAAWYNRRANTA